MDASKGYSEQITDVVLSWTGVTAGVGSRGEWAFKHGGRELGHLHGDHVAHFGFPKGVWRVLFAEGRISPHPGFPGREGPAARRIDDGDDVADVIALLRSNYERSLARSERAVPTPS